MNSERNDNSGREDTGDFTSDELNRSQTGEYRARRKRRRRARTKTKNKATKILSYVAAGLFCITLVSVGIFLGLSFDGNESNQDRYREAMKTRDLARKAWLTECNGAGHSQWTCNRFDRVHFEKAKHLDEFRCAPSRNKTYDCLYRLGSAEVIVSLPESYSINGVYVAPRGKSHAKITNSTKDGDYFIAVSAAGNIEFRKKAQEIPVIILNPATGSMNTLGLDVKPDAKAQDD